MEKNKLVVQLQGRLGNQLFEVATGYSYALSNNMDFYVRESDMIHFPDFDKNPPNCYNRYRDFILDRFKIFPTTEQLHAVRIAENNHQDFISIPANINQNVYLFGIWQSADYFPDFDMIRDLFKMSSAHEQNLRSKFDFDNSVGISIRRGDYLKFKSDVVIPLIGWYLDVCNKHFKGMKFIVSSDSIDWCKQNFIMPNTQFIDEGAEENMRILSLCKHHVLSNSTFSWWTAFLCKDSDSKVIYPDRFWVKPNLFFRDNFYLKTWREEHIRDDQYEK